MTPPVPLLVRTIFSAGANSGRHVLQEQDPTTLYSAVLRGRGCHGVQYRREP